MGGTQTFTGTSALNASATDAITNGTQTFTDTSTLDASATGAINGGTQAFKGSSTLKISAAGAISGGTQQFTETSALDATVASAINSGTLTFSASSSLNAAVAGSITSGTQVFNDSASLNASAEGAIQGGQQNFNATSSLNVSAANAITNSTQTFTDTSTLNATATGAISGGTQVFQGNARLKVSAAGAINGGVQQFNQASALDASVAGAINGGVLGFNGNSKLHATAANAITDGAQNFHESSALHAESENAIAGGKQTFGQRANLVVTATAAVNGGVQQFANQSQLVVYATNGLQAGKAVLHDTSNLLLMGANTASNRMAVDLQDAGTRLNLNGQNALFGSLTGNGAVQNSGSADSTLSVDTSALGDSVFAGLFSPTAGNGNLHLNKLGSGTLTLTGNSTGMTGSTSVNGGRLAVNGSLVNSAVTINSGGTLGGNGIVGATVVNSGGRLAPGNSIGTLHVNNSLVFAVGSQFEVEIDDAGNSDRIDVSGGTGAVTLNGGTVHVLAQPGNYVLGNRYTLITTTGAVTGTFAAVRDNLAFLDTELDYSDPGKVELLLIRNAVGFADIAATRNQRASASGLASANLAVLTDAITPLDAATARQAFDQLSGEAHASALGVLIEDSEGIRQAMAERLSQADRGLWGKTATHRSTRDSTTNTANLRDQRSSQLIGFDRPLANSDWHLGVVGGYSNNRLDTRNSKVGIDTYHLGAYAGTHYDQLQVKLGTSASAHRVDSKRNVAFAGYSSKEKSAYNATGLKGFAELSYPMAVHDVELEPFINLAGVRVQRDGFSEKGGDTAALKGRSVDTFTTFTTLGTRLRHGFNLGDRSVQLTGSLGLRHADGDITPESKNRFAAGDAFSVQGSAVARQVLVYEAGLSTVLAKGVTLGVGYAGQSGSGTQNHSGQVALGWAF